MSRRPDELAGAGRAGHDPHLAWSPHLIDPTGQSTANPIMSPRRGEAMTSSPLTGLRTDRGNRS